VATATAAAAVVSVLTAAPAAMAEPLATISVAAPTTSAPLLAPAASATPVVEAAQATLAVAAVPAPVAAPAAAPITTVPSAATSSALKAAMSKIGSPYRWGATGPSAFDCSGLVSWSFKQAGISLPRTSRAMSQVGRPVSKADLRPGDLVFFYKPVSHVAIYIGNGKVVHASTEGVPVKIADMSRMPFNSARRI
jgi:cell wall-associated NlpC family hydrolase